MKVEKLMSRNVSTCRPHDTMHAAAQIMWDAGVGSVAVVDDVRRVVGMITDRDLCMAAYTRALPLLDMKVSDAMSTQVHACRVDDSVESAEATMRHHQVRRLPVLDEEGRPVGVLSLTDLSHAAAHPGERCADRVDARAVTATLAGITERRTALEPTTLQAP